MANSVGTGTCVGYRLARISHHLTVEARNKPAMTALRLLTVLNVREIGGDGGEMGDSSRSPPPISPDVVSCLAPAWRRTGKSAGPYQIG